MARRNRPRANPRAESIVAAIAASSLLLGRYPFVSSFSPATTQLGSLASSSSPASSFCSSPSKRRQRGTILRNFQDGDDDDDDGDDDDYDYAVAAQIAKAKALLKDAKEKMDKKAAHDDAANGSTDSSTNSSTKTKDGQGKKKTALPFFASSKPQKIKRTTSSGEIIADGETMASLSEGEAWERRSLSQMFRNGEGDGDDDDLGAGSKALADKDVAMAIYNLRKVLQNEDFKKVFDSRNRFIGEID